MGDIILSFPLLKKLKEKFPKAKLHFLTKENYEDVVKLSPYVDSIKLYGESISELRTEIKSENYDLILDIHKNYRSIYASIYNGKKIKRYNKENLKKFLLVKFKKNLFKEIIPVFKKYLMTAEEYLDKDDYEFTVSGLNFSSERKIQGSYIVLSPSSKHFTKTYPAEKFIDFIGRYPEKEFIIVGEDTEKDRTICSYIKSKCLNTKNLCGKLSIDELANVIYYSDFVICNDSAILHLAEALGKKVISVFGSTVKEFGFFPQLKDSRVFEIKNLYCRPCTHIGLDKCPEKHFMCMDTKLQIQN